MYRIDAFIRQMTREAGSDSLVALIFAIVFSVGLYVYRRQTRKVYNLPPGPPTKFHHGNLQAFAKDPKIYLTLVEMAKEYGKIYRVYTGPRLVVVLNSYDMVKESLIKQHIEFSGRPKNLSNEIQSDHYHGVIFAPYSGRWKTHRKMFNQALRNFATGDCLVEHIHESMTIASDFLHPHLGSVYDPFQFITLIVYNFICAMCLGRTYDPEEEDYKMLCFRRRKITDTIGSGFDADFFPYKKILELTRVKQAKELVNGLLTYAKTIIDDHRKGFSSGVVKDFTDYLLASQQETSKSEEKLNDRHLVNTIMDVFSAGTETTVHTLYWMLLYVASYPEVQRKMHEQIDNNVGRRTLIDLKMKKKLPYIDAVAYEVMRLRPAVPMGIPRSTICDTKIGEYDIPKDTDILVNIWTLHHDPDEWDEPDQFKPERFLDEDGSLGPKPQNFLPFGAGRRICVGESVAKPEICLVTAMLLQRYRFSLLPNHDVSFKPADLPFTSYSKSYEIIIEER